MGAAVLPSASLAAPKGSGGGGDSEYCNTLKDRLKLYHDISKDKSQPKDVREFYAAKARATLSEAKQEGCSWTRPAALNGRLGVAVDVGDATASRPAVRKRQRAGQPGTPLGAGAAIVFVKAPPTGDKELDDYCRKVAELITEAERAGDEALLSGDDAGAREWYALAEYFIHRATQNGCRFTFIRHRAGGIRSPLTVAVG